MKMMTKYGSFLVTVCVQLVLDSQCSLTSGPRSITTPVGAAGLAGDQVCYNKGLLAP